MRDDKPKPAGTLAANLQRKFAEKSKTNLPSTPCKTQSSPQLSSQTAASMAVLFRKMRLRYTHKWTSVLSTPELTREAMREWGSYLADLTQEQIMHGLEAWDGDWPPSLPELRKKALGEDDALHRSAAYKFFPKALPRPKARPELANENLAKMRKKPKLTPEQMDTERAKLRSKP